MQVRVQRSDTGQWLNTFGVWQSGSSEALNATDGSISGQGLVGLARPASYAGNISFDDFAASPATNDITSPALQVFVPSGGSNLSGTVNIPVSVQDSSGISQVQYLVDGNLVAVDVTSPYNWTLITPNFTNGSHLLTVVAFDTAGNVSKTQAQVTFENSNVGIPPAIPQHYPNIRIAELAYSGNPMGPFETTVAAKQRRSRRAKPDVFEHDQSSFADYAADDLFERLEPLWELADQIG